jgi:prolyl oligopeptidase
MDPLLFRQYTEAENKALANTYGPYHDLSRDGRWLVLYYYTGTRSNDISVLDFAAWRKQPVEKPAFRTVLGGTLASGASGSGPLRGDTLYLLTTLDAPNGRVVAVDLKNPEPAHWRELLPQRKEAALQDLQLAKGGLIVTSLVNASTRLERIPEAGGPPAAVALPGLGTAAVAAEPDRDEFFYAFESYNRPQTLYRLDPARGPASVWMKTSVPVDPDLVEVEQVWFPSKDGTKVSMFLVHKKGLKRDGNNPTLLYGYGGFSVSETPAFIATLFPWFEAGGVYVDVNLRGGGEYGDAWHKAGMLENKQNVFDDFIAAAEWLVKHKVTNPKRLAISGGSNGGLLTGAALVQRPDLFAAALVGVPLLDMLRYQNFLMAKYWVPEYGSSEDERQFAFLRRYSPYQNAKDGVHYPAVFLTAGEHDARVHPLHARKMAARLQAIGAAAKNPEPVLLWVDQDAGHGQGKPLDLQLRDVVDKRLFTMWRVGMLGQ